MGLTRAEVEKVSLLARLQLSEAELVTMTEQLGQVVGYIELLAELDAELEAEQVEPMAHAVEIFNIFRDDVVRPSLEREQMLANAPHADGECYLVPAVLGE
jgi:aspartyl-tRNA(Asn)/glutamyl-tRNA(Gln) amidotransferase subunit C